MYVPEAYYHIYNRGLNKRVIFKDDYDYSVFLNLLKRYLSGEPIKDKQGRLYESLHGEIELLAFCIMPTHFHLLVYQKDSQAMTKLLHKITTSYTAYFNKKYKRSGPLFQDRFKASRISKDDYLLHISRYIHLNPKDYTNWQYSSLDYYVNKKKTDWVMPGRILDLFGNDNYLAFLKDYEAHKKMLDEIKDQLANEA